jgi:predicted transcriptional regulator
MNSKQIKDVIYDTLRPCYRSVGQNELWKLVQETFYLLESIPHTNPPKMRKKLDESKKFSISVFRKALNTLVEEGRVYVYDDKEKKNHKKLYYTNIDFDEISDLFPSRLDNMLNVYQIKLDSVLSNLNTIDNIERAKLLWKSYLLLFTAENQVILYSEIYSDKLNTKPLLSRIHNLRNKLDNRLHSMGISNNKELIQILLNEVVHTAITSYDSIDIPHALKT